MGILAQNKETWSMKAKNWLLLSGLALSGLVWNGCYTQIARPSLEEDEDTQVAATAGEESGEATRDQESDESYTDDRHVTNVYVYDDFRWGWRRPYWAYSSRYGYRYPRSRFYVSVGFGYYDPYDSWGWCGTPWSWCDPWDSYYGGYWGPYSGWHPSYYDPFYYPRGVYRDRVADQRKRTITRRGSTPADDNSGNSGTYATGGSRGSLARPVAGTYARGDDGRYRRVRRPDGTGTTPGSTTEATNVIDRDNGNTSDSGRRTVRRTSGEGGDKTVARRPGNDGNSSGGYRGSDRRGRKEPASDGGNTERRGSGGSSGSGGSVSRPSGSSGQSSPPPKTGGSSGNSGSSERRRRN
jgi:hypothetical protein